MPIAMSEKLPTYSSKNSHRLQFFSHSNKISRFYLYFFSPHVDQKSSYVGEIIIFLKIATKSTPWKFYYVKVMGAFSPTVNTVKVSQCKSHGWIFIHCVYWKFHCVKVMGEYSSTVCTESFTVLKSWVNFHPLCVLKVSQHRSLDEYSLTVYIMKVSSCKSPE